jgi:hypothetical protein
MTTANTATKLLFTALLACAAGSGAVSAASPPGHEGKPRIMVPTPTPGPSAGGIAGCWTADRSLYGYHLRFCVHGGASTYTVTGSGLHCHARLRWQETWGGYGFTMTRTSCGRGMDWTADTFTCVLRGGWGGSPGRVAVPSPGARLDCTYWPAVWGYRPTAFSAHRA